VAKLNIHKIIPFLWFDNNAQDAVRFYTSVFKNSRIVRIAPMVSTFDLEGVRFMAINGGPKFKFNEAVSLYVSCETQEEVDYYWNALVRDGGKEGQCGWLRDKYGLFWQIVPAILEKFMSGPDRVKSEKVMQAMLEMVKLDIAGLKRAYDEG
jgi:predicted 3-demethylubiquinone-9 3-methyltransferase (glyoxalase superfamily)